MIGRLIGFTGKLRFEQGDRVICRLGQRLAPGRILQTNAGDPDDPRGGLFVAYVVKTDALSSDLPPETVGVPHDGEALCVRETCLPESLEKIAMFCAQADQQQHKLRFSPGDRVGFRVEDTSEGLDQWICGVVKETWPRLAGPYEFEGVTFAETVPYAVVSDAGHARPEPLLYCHRDDHTLIRKEANVPQSRTRGVAKRFEKRTLTQGSLEMFDHVTCRSKRVRAESEDSDE